MFGVRGPHESSLASSVVLNTDRSHYWLFGTLRPKGRRSGTLKALALGIQMGDSRSDDCRYDDVLDAKAAYSR